MLVPNKHEKTAKEKVYIHHLKEDDGKDGKNILKAQILKDRNGENRRAAAAAKFETKKWITHTNRERERLD